MASGDFAKYEAFGNDMMIADPAHFSLPLTPELIALLCDRHRGIGADGICYGPLPDRPIPTMRFFNPDGSEAEKSGNGLRIFARYLWDAGYVSEKTFRIAIGEDVLPVTVLDEAANQITMGMGRLSFASTAVGMTGAPRAVVGERLRVDGHTMSITAVSAGNPHCVVFTKRLELIGEWGPLLERAPYFKNRTNVQLVAVESRNNIRIAIWERGAGYTLASGTSACAAAGAAIRNGLCDSPIAVEMAGGTATVAIDGEWYATLTGEVSAVFRGSLAGDLRRRLKE